jgi:hypothetical protein
VYRHWANIKQCQITQQHSNIYVFKQNSYQV